MTNFNAFQRPTLFKKIFALTLLALLISVGTYAQNFIKGVVRDAQGSPLPGVSVLIKGSTMNGGMTDVDGKYSVKASSNDVLVFTYIGMKKVEVPVGSKKVINVTMEDNVSSLNEVVVVGYGTAKKQSLTGAVSAIKGDVLLEAPSTNVSSLLGGRLPGISSVQVSGEPGDDQASLRVRGSVNAVTYIVDGMPRSISDVDPNDIESVSVLKDGASAAVYGLNAAGGVVIITTKKGKEGKTSVTYDGTFGVSRNANFPKFMNGPEFADYYNMADMMDKLASGAIAAREDYTPIYTRKNIEAMLNNDPTDGWDNVDYINKVFKTGFNMKHNVTLQGGTKETHYFVSAGYMYQKGNIDNFDYRRYNVRTNLDTKIGKDFKLIFGAVGTVGHRQTPGFASGGTDDSSVDSESGYLSVAHQTIMMRPYLPEKWNGLYTSTPSNNTGLANSPLAAIYQSGYKKTRSTELQTNMTLEYAAPWLKGLNLKATGSYDYLTSYNKNLDTPYNTYTMNTSDMGTYVLANDPRGYTDNRLGEGQYTSEQLVGQLSAQYVRSLGKNNFDAMVLLEARDLKVNSFGAYAKKIPFAELPELSYGTAADSPISGSSDHTRNAGYVFRLKYDYDNTYLAEFSGRYDGSYLFSGNVSDKRWGFFPALSLGWRISNEAFMKELTFLDDLKIRASVGLLGNSDGVPSYAYLSTYSIGGKRVMEGSTTNSIYTSVIANPYLTWSKTRSSNVGFDATLWGGKLGIEFDYFYNLTYDILSYMGGGHSPSMGGYFQTYANNNRYDVKGLEAVLTHRNRFMALGKPFNYNIGANVTYSTSRWLRYTDSANDPSWRKCVGTSVDGYDVWEASGLYRSEDEITKSAWYGTRPNVGDIKYVDKNGDGVINEQDKARVGRTNRPKMTFGLNLGGSWNGFDCNLQFTGGLFFDVSLTGTYYNGYDDNTVWTQTFKEGANSPLWLVQKAWSVDNPNGTYPRLTLSQTGHGGDNGLASTFWLRNGNYIRLKSAQLGYSFPKTWMSAIGIQKVRLFVEGSNLFTIDSLPQGIDPESPRVNNGYYPQQRTFMGGVSITF